jgi:hypothetical protein
MNANMHTPSMLGLISLMFGLTPMMFGLISMMLRLISMMCIAWSFIAWFWWVWCFYTINSVARRMSMHKSLNGKELMHISIGWLHDLKANVF